MANLLTFNQVVEILKDISQRHYQINSFFLGRDWELENNDDITYPLFQVYPDSARMPIANGEYKTIEFRIVCKIVDLVQQSESNEKDVHSDCLRIAQDIINELNQHPFYIHSNASLVGDINISALEEYEDDFTAGWEFALNLKLINVNSYCGLPFEEITGYSASGPTSTGFSYSVQYLTCDTVTACTTLQNYIENEIANIPTGTTDNWYTTGATLNGTIVYFDRNDQLSAYTLQLSALTSNISSDNIWTSSTGSNSIIANNNTGNIANGNYSIVAGYANIVVGNNSGIFNGISNSAITNTGVIVNGYKNLVNSNYSAILNGFTNTVSGYYSTIVGGSYNKITNNASGSFIGGGKLNSATTQYSSVVGGYSNRASGIRSFIGGGYGNKIYSALSNIVGGFKNQITGQYASIVGGFFNEVNNDYSSILGGVYNTIASKNSSILGGAYNSITHNNCAILGGIGISSSYANTVYVPYLNIKSADTNTLVSSVLVKDTDGQVYVRDASTIGVTGNFLPLSGGTVTGNTTFQSNVTVTGITESGFFKVTTFGQTNPQIYADADTDTGIMFDGPDILSLHTGGYQRLLINSSGNISNGNFNVTPGFNIDFTGVTKVDTISASTLSATTVTYQIYSETIPTTATTYVINGNNGNYQSLTFNTGATITYSNMKPGYYNFLINLTGTTTLTLSGSSGWYTPNAIPVGFYQPLTLMSCIYDGSKMVVSTYEQLSQII